MEATKLIDFFNIARRLAHKLIAWKVKDFKSLVMVALIELLQSLLLRRQTATSCCIDDEEYLASICFEGEGAPILGHYGEIIDSHFTRPFLLSLLYHA